MTTLDLSQIKPLPGFDSLKWKRERQAQILKETKKMKPHEVLEYFRKGAERFDEEQRQLRVIREERAVS